MDEKEKKLQELRTIQATQKGLMGLNGKLGCIVRFLGDPIVAQTSFLYQNFLADPYDLPGDDQEVPYMDMGTNEEPVGGEWREDRNYDITPVNITKLGYHYDGLSSGMHFEVWYKGEENELTAYYKGYLVYSEVAGDLRAYVPLEEWEQWVEKLSTRAKTKQRQQLITDKQTNTKAATAMKQDWLERMAAKWGFK